MSPETVSGGGDAGTIFNGGVIAQVDGWEVISAADDAPCSNEVT